MARCCKNFPVDVLKDMHRGPIIGVDVARREGIDIEDFRDPPGFLGWVAAHGFQSRAANCVAADARGDAGR